MDFDACYHQGTPSKQRVRPVVITFQRQSDRDFVYANRMNLRKIRDLDQQRSRANFKEDKKYEDKNAQAEGSDCRSGKYMLHGNKEKYHGNTLNELPPPLCPSSVKQIQLDKDTIAYQ